MALSQMPDDTAANPVVNWPSTALKNYSSAACCNSLMKSLRTNESESFRTRIRGSDFRRSPCFASPFFTPVDASIRVPVVNVFFACTFLRFGDTTKCSGRRLRQLLSSTTRAEQQSLSFRCPECRTSEAGGVHRFSGQAADPIGSLNVERF